MDLKDKIIELDNKEKYIVIDSLPFSEKTILILGKLSKKEDDVSDLVFTEMVDNKVKKITDEEIINKIKEMYVNN